MSSNESNQALQLPSVTLLGHATENGVNPSQQEPTPGVNPSTKPVELVSLPSSMQASSRSCGVKRRLTPMELKQQQRQEREKRKRAKSVVTHSDISSLQAGRSIAGPESSTSTKSTHTTVMEGDLEDQREDTGNGPVHFSKPFKSARKMNEGINSSARNGARMWNEPLRRSASSPPSIAMASGGHKLAYSLSRAQLGNARPRRPLSSEDPLEDRPGLCNADGSIDGDHLSGEGSGNACCTNAGGGTNTNSSASSTNGQTHKEFLTVRLDKPPNDNQQAPQVGEGLKTVELHADAVTESTLRPGVLARGASRAGSGGEGGGSGGGGGRPAGTSLFAIVMSGTSSSSRGSNQLNNNSSSNNNNNSSSNNNNNNNNNNGEIPETWKASGTLRNFGSSRAKGGKVTSATSTLSSMLQNLRSSDAGMEDAPTMSAVPELECLAEATRDPMGTIAPKSHRGSSDDWMAVNLEKLSSYRVPETRMGFPDAAREGLRRSNTLPARNMDPARSAASVGGRRRDESTAARGDAGPSSGQFRKSRLLGERHWELGCPFPMGSLKSKTSTISSTSASANQRDGEDDIEHGPPKAVPEKEAKDAPSSIPAQDLPLRTRVRFEMAPGVPVPAGLAGTPGQLEFRALLAFAAGEMRAGDAGRSVPRRRRHTGSGLGRCVDCRGDSGSLGANERAGVGGCAAEEGDCGREAPSCRGGGGRQRSADNEERLARIMEGEPGDEGTSVASEVRMSEDSRAPQEGAVADLESDWATEKEEAMEQWRRATLYWAHPATALPQEALAAQKIARARILKDPSDATKARGPVHPGGSAEIGWTSFFMSRRRDWEQAFSSLYYGLLSRRKPRSSSAPSGASPADGDGIGGGVSREGFYLQCPGYTVLFKLIPEEMEGSRHDATDRRIRLTPAATMSQSTRRMRKRLKEAGVDFEMPLDPAGDKRDAEASDTDEDVLEEWKALSLTGNAKPAATYANEEDKSRPQLSLLFFRGHMAVHGLFDFLLEVCGCPTGMGGGDGGGRSGPGRPGDIPLLLSREPFLNASLKSLKVLEVIGHVLPSMIDDLAMAMTRACAAFSHPLLIPDGRRGADDGAHRSAKSEARAQGDGRATHPNPMQRNDTSSSTAPSLAAEGLKLSSYGSESGKELFRAVLSVDPGTAHLNAGFRVSKAVVADTATGWNQSEQLAVRACYCTETRAKLILESNGHRQRYHFTQDTARLALRAHGSDPEEASRLFSMVAQQLPR